MNKHDIVKAVKQVVYGSTEKYVFKNQSLLFKTGTRPIKRKYINANDDVVRNDVLQIEFFEANFKPSDVLWDIGSHYGHYSIFCASVAKGSNQIFSFEPDPVAREIQLKNVSLNHLDTRIKVFDIAVSDKEGVLQFKSNKGDSTSSIVKNMKDSDSDIITVPSNTIDNLLNKFPAPTFVKIDTEGAEIDILSAADKLLENKEVNFICELHPFAWDAFGVSYYDFEQIINKYGRTLSLLDNQKSLSSLPFYGTVLF